MKVRLYVEGGGDAKALRTSCRQGFARLLDKAGLRPQVVACGSRAKVFDRFQTALRSPTDCQPMLLVDSEDAVASQPWEHLKKQDGWKQPKNAEEDQAQLMVQCMETWCVADRVTLRRFFGQDLQENALPPLNDLEKRGKNDIQQALEHATRECGRDREYKKGKRSFRLIAELDPAVLKKRLPHFAKLCEVLDRKLVRDWT